MLIELIRPFATFAPAARCGKNIVYKSEKKYADEALKMYKHSTVSLINILQDAELISFTITSVLVLVLAQASCCEY